MRTISDIGALRLALDKARRGGRSIGFVPTMGNLHEGHLELVRRCRSLGDVVVVSIFVNPLQFGPGEDLDSYPRTLSADKEKLFAEGVHYLFTPTAEALYPNGIEHQTRVSVPGLSDTLCGSSRPGHFEGVATVVCKLFNIVQPQIAVFGEKDYQQLSIIRRMVADLCLPVQVQGIATVRDHDGLALSSRNGYLDADQRRVAPRLHEALTECRDAVACGFDNYSELESHARVRLMEAGFEPDYFAVRDAATLGPVTADTEEVGIFAAARLGRTRLIDNVRIGLNPVSDWGMLATR